VNRSPRPPTQGRPKPPAPAGPDRSSIVLVVLLGLVGLGSVAGTLLILREERLRRVDLGRAELSALVSRQAAVQQGAIEAALQALAAGVPWAAIPTDHVDELALFGGGPGGPQLIAPAPPSRGDPTLLIEEDCLRTARARATSQDIEGALLAFRACDAEPPAVRLTARSQAAALLTDHGEPSRALELLLIGDPPLPLSFARARELDPRELIRQRAEAAHAQTRLGREDTAEAILSAAVQEICDLPASDLELLLPTAERIARTDLGDAAQSPDPAACLAPARARLARWELLLREVLPVAFLDQAAGRALQSPVALRVGPATEAAVDGYAFIRTVADGRIAVATVSREGLQDALWAASLYREDAPSLAILDASGAVARGASPSTTRREVAFEVSAGTLLPDLRLVRWQGADPLRTMTQRLMVALGLPLAAAMVLGALAIARQARADRHLRELHDRQQAFITRVTHELKTPLAGIRVMAETIEMGAAEDRETNRIFNNRIIQEADNLGRRIEEVLTAARRPEVRNLTVIKPAEMAAALVEEWRPRIAQAGAVLEADLQPCSPVEADPDLLRDALGNLLDNALKYGRTGVRGLVRVRTFNMGDWVAFEVTDNGIGVPPAMRRRIFERFTRVEGPGRGKAGGHGLGLAFVQESALAHGGLVECLDGLEGGSRFRLKLKRAR
jgi:signal transduction histidine kinase